MRIELNEALDGIIGGWESIWWGKEEMRETL
jgi:hypothetical protein